MEKLWQTYSTFCLSLPDLVLRRAAGGSPSKNSKTSSSTVYRLTLVLVHTKQTLTILRCISEHQSRCKLMDWRRICSCFFPSTRFLLICPPPFARDGETCAAIVGIEKQAIASPCRAAVAYLTGLPTTKDKQHVVSAAADKRTGRRGFTWHHQCWLPRLFKNQPAKFIRWSHLLLSHSPTLPLTVTVRRETMNLQQWVRINCISDSLCQSC